MYSNPYVIQEIARQRLADTERWTRVAGRRSGLSRHRRGPMKTL
jgi:hypothetical protein